MIIKLKKIVLDYLNDTINKETFIYSCKDIYISFLESPKNQYQLDYILIGPFVHEFAYCNYTDSELKQCVRDFQDILIGNRSYVYSVFLKLEPCQKTLLETYEVFLNSDEIAIAELEMLFYEYIDSPTTVKDIINNLIYDLVSKFNSLLPNESDFDYINCNENISCSKTKDMLNRLVAYFCGIQPFFLQITTIPNGNTIYAII